MGDEEKDAHGEDLEDEDIIEEEEDSSDDD